MFQSRDSRYLFIRKGIWEGRLTRAKVLGNEGENRTVIKSRIGEATCYESGLVSCRAGE